MSLIELVDRFVICKGVVGILLENMVGEGEKEVCLEVGIGGV